MTDDEHPPFVAPTLEAPTLETSTHALPVAEVQTEAPSASAPADVAIDQTSSIEVAETVTASHYAEQPVADAESPAAEGVSAVTHAEPALAEAEPPVPEVAKPASEASATPAPGKAKGPRTVGFDPSVEERKQRAQAHWLSIVAARDSGETLNGKVTAAVKGGLLVDVGGIRGFLPASQTRLEAGAAIESLVKTTVPLRVIDVDEQRRRIVVSQRRALEDLRRAKRSELLRSLQIGQLHEGVVVRLAPFGAFVDIGGLEGLVPMSELAFERVEKVEDVLKVGERLPVAILRVDEGGKKIGLSRKNALPDPLRDHAALLKPGTIVEGKVVGKDARLQVEIAPGVVGSVRESDADPNDYEIGEAIEVSVRYVDRRTRRVVLTTLHGAATVQPRSSGFAPLGEELLRKRSK
jgi:small subunit ribosomal protein S1